MITKNGKRVLYTNEKIKQKIVKAKAETAKHAGKIAANLTPKEKSDLLAALCERYDLIDANGILKL